jgi:hypothetical protein
MRIIAVAGPMVVHQVRRSPCPGQWLGVIHWGRLVGPDDAAAAAAAGVAAAAVCATDDTFLLR